MKYVDKVKAREKYNELAEAKKISQIRAKATEKYLAILADYAEKIKTSRIEEAVLPIKIQLPVHVTGNLSIKEARALFPDDIQTTLESEGVSLLVPRDNPAFVNSNWSAYFVDESTFKKLRWIPHVAGYLSSFLLLIVTALTFFWFLDGKIDVLEIYASWKALALFSFLGVLLWMLGEYQDSIIGDIKD